MTKEIIEDFRFIVIPYMVNRFKETADYKQGIVFFIKDVANKRIWVNTPIDRENRGDKYVVSFAPERSEFVRIDADIESTTKIIVSPDDPVEIRRIEIENLGNKLNMNVYYKEDFIILKN